MSKTVRTAVIGHPVGHSKSPIIHMDWIKRYRIDGHYRTIDIPPETLEEGVRGLVAEGYKGFNVTIPHKEAMLKLCDQLDDTARHIGAVNTVVIKNKKLYGQNTDAYGFVESIRHKHKDFNFTGGKAVVLGAGGAARAVLYALIQQRVPEIVLLNRTRSKAEELKVSCIKPNMVNIQDWDTRDDALKGANMLVNTTSLGMQGQPPLDLYLQDLSKEALIVDLVYAPLHTDLICEAIKRKNPYVLGTGMLLHQARPAFKAWYDVLPTVTPELEEKITT